MAQHNKKHYARQYALQALYQMALSGDNVEILLAQYLSDTALEKYSKAYFELLLKGVTADEEALDMAFQAFVDMPIEQLDCMVLLILRLAAFELKTLLNVPEKVIMNEAILLAKDFAPTDSYKLVNAVVEKLVKPLRDNPLKTA